MKLLVCYCFYSSREPRGKLMGGTNKNRPELALVNQQSQHLFVTTHLLVITDEQMCYNDIFEIDQKVVVVATILAY